MHKMTDTDWAYLAGFMDADGCISLTQTPRREIRFQIVFSQANKSVLDYWQIKTGFGRVSPMASPPGVWQWQIGKPECDDFLEGVFPHLLLKKEEASIAMRYRATFDKRYRYTKVTAGILSERMACVQAMREKKGGRHVLPPDFCLKPNDLGYHKSSAVEASGVSKPTAIQLAFSHLLSDSD